MTRPDVVGAPDLRQVRDRHFWLDLIPGLHIAGTAAADGSAVPAFPLAQHEPLRQLLRHEGYAQFDQLLDGSVAGHLAKAVARLVQHRITPVFAFVYDEFWWLAHQLRSVLAPVLGDGYVQLPDFWVWYLDPSYEQSGWTPHRDKVQTRCLDAAGLPLSLTTWCALTEVSPLNGCMYLLPAHLDPNYASGDTAVPATALSAVRALPGPAGTVFAWNQRILHWGGRASHRANMPRISVAFEFQRGDIPPFNTPLLAPDTFPDLATRLRLIGKQVLQYTHMYGYRQELVAVAQALSEDG
ncbi:MAG: phytanoyl-CoA dioxygenase family protein [Pseudomonadota bacterium]